MTYKLIYSAFFLPPVPVVYLNLLFLFESLLFGSNGTGFKNLSCCDYTLEHDFEVLFEGRWQQSLKPSLCQASVLHGMIPEVKVSWCSEACHALVQAVSQLIAKLNLK